MRSLAERPRRSSTSATLAFSTSPRARSSRIIESPIWATPTPAACFPAKSTRCSASAESFSFSAKSARSSAIESDSLIAAVIPVIPPATPKAPRAWPPRPIAIEPIEPKKPPPIPLPPPVELALDARLFSSWNRFTSSRALSRFVFHPDRPRVSSSRIAMWRGWSQWLGGQRSVSQFALGSPD